MIAGICGRYQRGIFSSCYRQQLVFFAAVQHTGKEGWCWHVYVWVHVLLCILHACTCTCTHTWQVCMYSSIGLRLLVCCAYAPFFVVCCELNTDALAWRVSRMWLVTQAWLYATKHGHHGGAGVVCGCTEVHDCVAGVMYRCLACCWEQVFVLQFLLV